MILHVLLLACLCMWIHVPLQSATDININSSKPIAQVLPEFLSLAIDAASIFTPPTRGKFNYSSPRLDTLLQGLSPAILRVGGSPADWLIFNRPQGALNVSGILPAPVVMTKTDWDHLVWLTSITSNRLLFDLDLQLRFGTQWDPSNAIELFEYTVSQGYGSNIDWELGNEPNEYSRPGETQISGKQLGQDFLSLARVIRHYDAFRKSCIIGPDVVGNDKLGDELLRSYLDVAGGSVDAMTIHQYYFRGDTAKWTEYVNPKYLNGLGNMLTSMKKMIKNSRHPEMPLWIGETSDAWHSGTANVSDRYISAFLWLDKLGVAAKHDVKVVMRETFWGHNYALTDDNMYPNPDYWLSLLHKNLVGMKVLNVSTRGQPDTTRVYAHCASSRSYTPGAVTVFALNVHPNVTDHLTFTDARLKKQVMYVYFMAPADPKLKLLSKTVLLNGVQLKMVDDHTLPPLAPVTKFSSQGFLLPPRTYVFLVFPNADYQACLS